MNNGPLAENIVKAFDSLTPQLQVAARYVLDHPRDVALLSMREQARRAGVQPATMTRLAKHLGFNGYEDIKDMYADAVRENGPRFAGKAGVQVASQKLQGDRGLVAEMLASFARQVAQLAQPGTIERIVTAAERLAAARRVYCCGLRSSHSVAWHLHYVLTLIGERSIHVDGIAATGTDTLACATPEDVLLVASVLPYTRLTVELAGYAAGRSIPIVALTDSEVAPLAQMATQAIIVPTDSPSFFHTMSPAFMVAEILGALIAGRGGSNALTRLRHMDEHLAALGTHLQTRHSTRSS